MTLPSLKTGADRLNALLLASLFTMPLGRNGLTSLLMLLLLIQAIVLYRKVDWLPALKNPIVLSSAAYFAFMALSLGWSDYPGEGGAQLETKTSFLLAPLVIIAGKRHWQKDTQKRALELFVYGVVLSILLALGYAAYRSFEVGAFSVTHEAGTRYFFLYTHLASPIMHPGYMATYVGIALLMCIHFIWKSKEVSERWRYGIYIALFGVIMILLQARINLIALLLVVGIGLWVYAWIKKKFLLTLAPLVGAFLLGAVVWLAPSGLTERYVQLPNFDYDISGNEDSFNSATYRLAIWKCAAHTISENPLFGTGIGENRVALFESYEEFGFWQGLERKFNCHNQYLETLLLGGAVGLFFLVCVLTAIFRSGWKRKDYLLQAVLLFVAISLLTESMFERMWAVVLFAVLLPLMSLRSKPLDSET